MDTHACFLTSIATVSFFFYFFLTTLPQAHSQEDDKYLVCTRNQSCGLLPSMYYPFWSETENRSRYCGRDGFELKCQQGQNPSIQVGSQNFSVLVIDPINYTMRMVRTDMGFNNVCSWDWDHLTNISLSANLFSLAPTVRNFSIFYDCPTGDSQLSMQQQNFKSGLSIQGQNFTCQNESVKFGFYVEDTLLPKNPQLEDCRYRIQVPTSMDLDALKTGDVDALKSALKYGFEVQYFADNDRCNNCSYSKGICGTGEKS